MVNGSGFYPETPHDINQSLTEGRKRVKKQRLYDRKLICQPISGTQFRSSTRNVEVLRSNNLGAWNRLLVAFHGNGSCVTQRN